MTYIILQIVSSVADQAIRLQRISQMEKLILQGVSEDTDWVVLSDLVAALQVAKAEERSSAVEFLSELSQLVLRGDLG